MAVVVQKPALSTEYSREAKYKVYDAGAMRGRPVAATLVAVDRRGLVSDFGATLADRQVDVAWAHGRLLPDQRFHIAMNGEAGPGFSTRAMARALSRAEPTALSVTTALSDDFRLEVAATPGTVCRTMNWIRGAACDLGMVITGFGTRCELNRVRALIEVHSGLPIMESSRYLGRVPAAFFRYDKSRHQTLLAAASAIRQSLPTMAATAALMPPVERPHLVSSQLTDLRLSYLTYDFIGAFCLVADLILRRGGAIHLIDAQKCKLSASGAIDGFCVTAFVRASGILNRREAEKRFAPDDHVKDVAAWDAEMGWSDESPWVA